MSSARPQEETLTTPQHYGSTTSRRPGSRALWAGAAVVAVALVFGAIVAFSRLGGEAVADPRQEAERACTEEYVPGELKAPATAQFSDVASTREGDSGYITVTGAVDAQNGFGALIRMSFKCYVHVENGAARMISADVTE
jgi:hypothetical protein